MVFPSLAKVGDWVMVNSGLDTDSGVHYGPVSLGLLHSFSIVSREWTRLETVGKCPPPRLTPCIFDGGEVGLVIAGGLGGGIVHRVLSDTWAYDTHTQRWTQLEDSPGDGLHHLSPYHVRGSHIFPGTNGCSLQIKNGRAEWTEAPWTSCSLTHSAPGRLDACFAAGGYGFLLTSKPPLSAAVWMHAPVSSHIVPREGVPVDCRSHEYLDVALLNATTAVVVGPRDTVVLDMDPEVVHPESGSANW
ncbi:hypothetical protein KIPB_008109 [Kipferlia bialata]|uniref:Kelch-type beta propeller n=1 Tax=Kipferlia bialata TaxID=797122 RepID=A0A391NMX1_9EUKA|nr:hypothetical protein KIPB_008109 [Kipferlia bialata]|eukprot:g8109.t1